jgi:molybdenum cofactor biosynthesis protein B
MASASSSEHKRKAAEKGPVLVAIVTVSDTRTPETDANSSYLREEVERAGHRIHSTRVVRDEPAEVEAALEEVVAAGVQVALFNGGTGISRRDRTFDVLSGKLEKTLPGFGELFRALSYEQVGAAAMFSRATAGVYRETVVVSTPGSPAAVRLAWEKLIRSELQHLAWEIAR